jgi:hypothetical protein
MKRRMKRREKGRKQSLRCRVKEDGKRSGDEKDGEGGGCKEARR